MPRPPKTVRAPEKRAAPTKKTPAAATVEEPAAPAPKKARAPVPEEPGAHGGDVILDGMLAALVKEQKKQETAGTSIGSSATRLSDDGLSIHLPGVLSTGSEWLDLAIGRGGIPYSRTTLLVGDEGSGKTTLALTACANCQRAGGIAIYIEAEFKLDRDYARSLGVDVDRLLLIQPEHMEGAFDTIQTTIAFAKKRGSKQPILIVIDSINALPTIQELEGKDTPGTSARTFSMKMRQTVKLLSDQRVALLLISQVRQKIGVTFGSASTTGCGKAPRFYAAVIMDLTVIQGVKEGGVKIGNRVKVEITKNQIAAPFRKGEYILRFGAGIDWVHSLHEAARTRGVIQVDGSWATWTPTGKDSVRWQGPAGLRKLLESGGIEQIRDLITQVRAPYGWNDTPPASHLPALLAAGAPYHPGIVGDEGDDDDEGDDGEGES